MAEAQASRNLEKVGKNLIRWKAELKLTWCLAAALGVVFLLGIVDIWLQLGRVDRFIVWVLLLAVIGFGLRPVLNALRKRYSSEGVAAMIEKSFPQLDNHLINYLQMSRNPEGDPFKAAYVRDGGPRWQDLDFRQMRDGEAHKRGRILLIVALAALCLPILFVGKAWPVAVWRTVNPFASTPPLSLTRILDVQPGSATVLQGESLVLTATVKGFKGHEVRVDVDPGDADRTTYSLGRITADIEQQFSHRIPKVATALRYRFRAGDSPASEWFRIDARPPPSFTGIQVTIKPPAYTGRPATTADVRNDQITVPAGSEVSITATSNTPLRSAKLRPIQAEPAELAATDYDAKVWAGSAIVTGGSTVRLEAVDEHGVRLEEEIGFVLVPDRLPAIEIVAPGGRTVLPPGEFPRIQFRVSDDYGLGQVMLEEVRMNATADDADAGKALQTWPLDGAGSVEKIWTGEVPAVRGRDTAYRVVALDARPGEPNRAASSPIIFSAPGHGDMAKQRNELEQKAFSGLQKILDLQKNNIAQTRRQREAMAQTTPGEWKETTDRQVQIRGIARDLLANPIQPLGGLTPAVKKLYVNEMVLAIDSLKAIPRAADDARRKHAGESLAMQEKILRQLASAQSAATEAKLDRRVTGLAAMLEALIRGQGNVLKQTRGFADNKAKVSPLLVDAQDALAEELTAFINASKSEAAAVRGNDAGFADTLVAIVGRVEELKIRNDMVMAAERLDGDKPGEAVTLEERAIVNLKLIQAMLNKVQLEEEAEKRETMVEAIAQAKEKLQKIRELHEKMLESMEGVRGASDKNTELFDTMEEAYEDILKNTKESLLEIPTDLHVFTDLNVANDIVEDIISVFQEVEQAADTGEKQDAKDVVELGFAKEDIMLEMMEEAEDRLDDMEMWLSEKPDAEKVDTEAFDREEMPESGIATGALANEVEDLIGDLLEEDEEQEEEAQNSATTHALPDWEAGWEIMEGDIASYGAKGKSGNETPDHHEQDGRSNVGRQGMSVGETAAGSGTISEGDKNIEERRTEDPTQSGQVDLDGEADTKATGGGKLATGKADDLGMGGGVERMDSKEAGSQEGMDALMAKHADAIYAKASLKNVRVDSLKSAAHHLRQSADAVAKGDIGQVKEARRIALSSLKRAQAELAAGPTGGMTVEGAPGPLDDVVESGPDLAPPQFRDRVADYYKALNEAL